MAFTTHGHQIPGTPAIAQRPAKPVARCGGPGVCVLCSTQAQTILNKVRAMDLENTWDKRDPGTGRHKRNGHIIKLGECEWRCERCNNVFDAAIDADKNICEATL